MMRRVHILLLVLVATAWWAAAQDPVAAPERWVATVDSSTQCVVLRWSPSPDPRTWGYHICTGTPCTDYDTVFGRTDTSLLCADHLATEAHTYRLHVFDSSHNVSALTPPFGNMVLQAVVPECSTDVSVSWTPYVGMPGGVNRYRLLVRQEPHETDFTIYYSTDTVGPLAYNFQMSPATVRVGLRVQAISADGLLTSESNTVLVNRRTADTASRLDILAADYDSASAAVVLAFDVDTAFHAAPYCLWRSTLGSPWRLVASFIEPVFSYSDYDLGLYDSLQCYQLSVADACGLNERFSPTACAYVPPPPPPAVAVPNAVVVGSETNGAFRPHVSGLMGDLYDLAVYDRQGRLVFHTDDPSCSWLPDASTRQGAYTYCLHLRFVNNRTQTFTGTVLVIK